MVTSPIQEKQNRTAPIPARRDWCCGTPISGPHTPGCMNEPRDGDNIYANETVVAEPPAVDPQPGPAPAAPSPSQPRQYGFKKRPEFDVELPSGGFVRVRQLKLPEAIELGILDLKDSFAEALFKHIGDLSEEQIQEAEEALRDKEQRGKFFGPLDRVAAAALICPQAVLEHPAADGQIHVDEIDLIDKLLIFEASMPEEMKAAALGAQQETLKSVRGQPEAGVRDLRDGDAVPPEAE